jgi:hypothetical protein
MRQSGLQLTDGNAPISEIPKVNGAYDLKALSQQALSLKREHADATDASVLSEPRIAYDDIIQVMDAIRSTQVTGASGEQVADTGTRDPNMKPAKAVRVDLFTNIAMGDAP